MSRPVVDQMEARVKRRGTAGANAVQIAQAVAASCRDVEVALTPIIGARGVAELFRRCLFLTVRTHAWLGVTSEGEEGAFVASSLQAALARRSGVEAATAGLLFLRNFDALLVSLIGASLTERLLDPVWTSFLKAPPVLDPPS